MYQIHYKCEYRSARCTRNIYLYFWSFFSRFHWDHLHAPCRVLCERHPQLNIARTHRAERRRCAGRSSTPRRSTPRPNSPPRVRIPPPSQAWAPRSRAHLCPWRPRRTAASLARGPLTQTRRDAYLEARARRRLAGGDRSPRPLPRPAARRTTTANAKARARSVESRAAARASAGRSAHPP